MPGLELTVINAGAHILDVYGRANDTINAIAATSPYSGMAAGTTCKFTRPVEAVRLDHELTGLRYRHRDLKTIIATGKPDPGWQGGVFNA